MTKGGRDIPYLRLSASRSRRRRGGQILVMAILAITMLVALVFYVYNIGDQVNRRSSMQNVADAVAVSGAGWMARSMNVVAMNNVAQTRMIAIVPVLDAIPLACEMAHHEASSWSDGLSQTINGLRSESGISSDARAKIIEGLQSILTRLQLQRDILAPMLAMKDEIEQATTWSLRGVGGPPPHGNLWRSAVTLDAFSQTTVASAGVLAQANAVRFADRNGNGRGFIVPVVPHLPAVRGEFADFKMPISKRLRVDLEGTSVAVENGAGGAIPNAQWPHRLGPWARLLCRPTYYRHWDSRVGGENINTRGWRHSWGLRVPVGSPRTVTRPPREGRRISGPSAGSGRAGQGANRGRGARKGGTYTYQPTRQEVRGYKTYGPFYWASSLIYNYAGDFLNDTRFREYFMETSAAKLGYLFDVINPTLKEIHYPLWITDLQEAQRLGNDPNTQKTRTRYYYIEVISKEPESSSGWANSITSDNLRNPVTRDFSGWFSPDNLRWLFGGGEVTGPEQIGNLPMWKFTATGMERRYWPNGSLKDEWPVYFVWYFVFGGLDVGGNTAISNPANWDEFDELPAPMLLDITRADYVASPDEGPRREYFAYLGVARRPSPPAVWGQKFALANPTGSVYAMAQAKVFNNTSWDLWTQDWQVQLTRLKDWSDWTDRLSSGTGDAPLTGGMVTTEELERAHTYMSAFPPSMAELYINH